MMLCALALAVLAQAPPAPTPVAPPSPAAVKPLVILLDDRTVKDQAPGAFLQRTEAALGRLRDVKVVKISEGRKKLDPRANKELSGCGDDAGCLATAARDIGADVVVCARLTRREGAFFLALTRVAALRPQMSEDAGTLAGSEADALAAVPEQVAELFPEIEEKAP